eukprot:gnl/Spiro4/1352_TR721_c0_g3_i1.p1 gnl/Spiro4/1352_TR721_c0_g3~~gnl/Spiro4/1352_TR721_c0_g3_i1.p1  ORF type:complete len:923 (-),score=232.35 gnl/Spiro4/1352_TR721_c0_g3_i1:82-2811(-)
MASTAAFCFLVVLLPCCFGSCDDYKSCEECLSGKAGRFQSGEHCKWCPEEYLSKEKTEEMNGPLGYCGVGKDADLDNYDGHPGWCTIPDREVVYKDDESQPSYTVFRGWINPLRTVTLKPNPLPLSAQAAGKVCRNFANLLKFEDISLRALDTDRSQTKRGASEDQGDGDLGDTSAEQLRALFENHELLNLATLDILRVLRVRSLDGKRFAKAFPEVGLITTIKDVSKALLEVGVRFGIKTGVHKLVEVAAGNALPGLGVAIESIEVLIDWVRKNLDSDSVQARLIDKGREAFTGAFPDITFDMLMQAYHDTAENLPQQFSEHVKTLLESDPNTIVKRMKKLAPHALSAEAFERIVRSELARIPHSQSKPLFDKSLESVRGACEALGGSGFQKSEHSTPDFFLDDHSTGEEYHIVLCNVVNEAVSRILDFEDGFILDEQATMMSQVKVPPLTDVKKLVAFYHEDFRASVRSIRASANSPLVSRLGSSLTTSNAEDVASKCNIALTLDELPEKWGKDSSNQDRVQDLYILMLCNDLRALVQKSLKDPDDSDVSDPAYQKAVDEWKKSMEEAHFSALTNLRLDWLVADLVQKIEELYPDAGGTKAVTAYRVNKHGGTKVGKATVHTTLAVVSFGLALLFTVPADVGATLGIEKAYSDSIIKKANLLMTFLYFFEARTWYTSLGDQLSAEVPAARRRVVFCDVANGLPRGGCHDGSYCKREWLFWPEAVPATFEFQKFSSRGRCAPYYDPDTKQGKKVQDRLGKSGDPCLAHLSCLSGYCDFPVVETKKGSNVFISANDYRRLDQVPIDHDGFTDEQLLALSYGVCKTLIPRPLKEVSHELWPKGCKDTDARADFLVCSLTRERISKLHKKLELERDNDKLKAKFNDDFLFQSKLHKGADRDSTIRSHEAPF